MWNFGIPPHHPDAATATSGLAVSFSSTTTSVCTVVGATVTIVGAGTCSVIASQAWRWHLSSRRMTPVTSKLFRRRGFRPGKLQHCFLEYGFRSLRRQVGEGWRSHHFVHWRFHPDEFDGLHVAGRQHHECDGRDGRRSESEALVAPRAEHIRHPRSLPRP